MYSTAFRARAIALCDAGANLSQVALRLGIARSTLREWTLHPDIALADVYTRCFICGPDPCESPTTYAYLLGQYLGDGYLVTSVRVPKLRIACAGAYPGIAAEVDASMALLSGNTVGSVASIGCSDRYCYWMLWPCLFPQHGPGRKHLRPIVLAEWQREIVAAYPWPLIRGLIHSDGCRAINRVVVRGKAYIYPRYFFANESRDILAIMGTSLDQVGAQWRFNRPNSISIARRRSVELLEQHVGPKS